MSTGIEDSRLRNAAPLEDRLEFQHPQAAITANTTRQNLAGGSGVFANFFEELAGPQNSGITACDPASSIVPDGNLTYNPDGFPHEYFHVGDSLCPSIPNAFYVPYEEDNDITILDQYKRFTDRSRGASSLHPYLYGISSPEQSSPWGGAAVLPSPQPVDLSDYVHGELGSDMCIAYSQRCKPPKVLAKRFLLGETVGRGSYGKLIDGLHFLHRCGVIHRDIKPANLLLTPAPGCGLSPLYSVADFMDTTDTAEMDGSRGFLGRSLSEILMASRGWLMKLTDFGVSASLSTFIATDEVSGGQTTPAVQPPEVAKGVQSVFAGSKLDVYSAGVSLYFMLTGRVPFSCINVLQIFEAIAQGDYTIPGHVSASAAHLVRKMMCKDPKKRFTLEQIAKHPWVLNDPPSPISLEQIRSKMQGHSPAEFTSTWSERGFVCWLDPLEFLRRPGFDYPAPHIDETGARIFTPVELGLLDAPCEPSSPSPSEDVSVNSGEPSGIAPFSVLERLKVYHALYDPEGSARPDAINPGFTSNHNSQGHFIESKLSNLGISPIPHYAIQPMAFKKQRYYSEGLENIHHFEVGSSSLPAVYRQRGVTISLPTGSVSDRRYTMRNPMPSEPPLCPADLPVSPPLTHFPDSHTTMNVGAGGTMRADGLFSYGKPASTHVPWSKSEASESKAARHPQFRLGSDVLTLADFHPSQLVVARDSQFEDSETKLATQLSPGSNVPPDCVPSTPVKERPRTRLRRRVTLWFASLHRRLRNRSQRDSYLNESGLDRSRTCDSPFYHPVDPPSSMQNSVTSEPPSTDKHRSKSRRWLTIRSLSRHGKS
ncbi:unnamed protein product [Dicrocoelium dendriticum]|nr:unnamed protein product [Dicrocoelium dendriticum]